VGRRSLADRRLLVSAEQPAVSPSQNGERFPAEGAEDAEGEGEESGTQENRKGERSYGVRQTFCRFSIFLTLVGE
jgi:hypothetical protein